MSRVQDVAKKLVDYVIATSKLTYQAPIFEMRQMAKEKLIYPILDTINSDSMTLSEIEKKKILIIAQMATVHQKHKNKIPLGQAMLRVFGLTASGQNSFKRLASSRIEYAGLYLVDFAMRAKADGVCFDFYDMAKVVTTWDYRSPKTGVFIGKDILCRDFYRAKQSKK